MSGRAPLLRFGWAGKAAAERAFDGVASSFVPLGLPLGNDDGATSHEPVRLWGATRAVLGRDTDHRPQRTGDCVSFGAKNAVEHLQCVEIVAGEAEGFRPVFPPFLYATGRVLVGGGRLSGRAGSLGSWQAEAVRRFGVLRADADGVPAYSGGLADRWGDGRPAAGAGGRDVSFRSFLDAADDHPVGAAARVRTWGEVVAAVSNGYPVTVASDCGFTMRAGRSGFHERRGTWPHQMCLTGVHDDPRRPWAAVLNSWGDVHGSVQDFADGTRWPPATLRVRREAVGEMLRRGEAYAYSRFAGFPPRRLDWGRLIG